jgi:hypothetical protein
MRFGIKTLIAGLPVFLALGSASWAEGTNETPDFKEVYDLIRTHLPGISEADLNQAAVKGLVSALAPRVSLTGDGQRAATSSETPLVSRSGLLDKGIAYVRVGRVGPGLAEAVRGADAVLGATNTLNGLVLDLRYADGNDYAVVAEVADLFAGKEQPLLDWGTGMVSSKAKTNSIDVPVALLTNHQTARAAEALAAVLREMGSGLILGGKTAGEALITQDFPLKNGQHLRVATVPIRLGDGTSLLGQSIKPDIAVEVDPDRERAFYADAFKDVLKTNLPAVASLSATNQPDRSARKTRFNEAELVRERKEGLLPESEMASASRAESETPAILDPVLARAMDLLQGLAVVRHGRP